MTSPHNRCQPTCHGFVRSAKDALLVLEACLQGHLLHVPRGLLAKEARQAVQSGAVFVYELGSSGVRDWEDFRLWGQEAQLGDFRIQTELVNSPGLGSNSSEYRANGAGLTRQSITLQWNKTQHHIVSYFSWDDMMGPRRGGITGSATLNHINVRQELLQQQQHLHHPPGFDPFVDSAVQRRPAGDNEASSPDAPLKDAEAVWGHLLHEFHRLGWRMVDGRPRLLDPSIHEVATALVHLRDGEDGFDAS
ncbi:hypothetical protein CEP54_015975 [Fusarium duplospermum]|uniref:Uncharacterized protein n=1 Tax=Fusarium duplospermum TaxID=1325734 RepID=A0A428NJF0_9HYPO|nr:hypothetical protein CEP54_015975 [Fusarium duplospermum]